MQLQGYDLIGITEMWWDCSHSWSVAMDGYKLFGKDGEKGELRCMRESSTDTWRSSVGWVTRKLRACGSRLGGKPTWVMSWVSSTDCLVRKKWMRSSDNWKNLTFTGPGPHEGLEAW